MSQRKRIYALLVIALLLFQFAPGSLAEDTVPAPALVATINATGTAIVTPDTYTVVLEAKDGAPMPASAVDGKITLTREGTGDMTFPALSFDSVGVFAYTITQTPGNHPSATVYDDEEYTVTYYITYGTDGKPFLSEVMEKEDGTKTDKVVFEDEYAETSVTAAKAWDDGDDQDGKREDVTFVLKGTYNTGDGIPHSVEVKDAEKTIAKDAEGEDSKVTWTELPMKYKTWPITYTVSEKGATGPSPLFAHVTMPTSCGIRTPCMTRTRSAAIAT